MKRIAVLAVLAVLVLAGCSPALDPLPTVVDPPANRPPVCSADLNLGGRPNETYVTVLNRYLIDLRYRAADERGPWTGIYDPDGDSVEVLSVRAWMVLDGEHIEDAVFHPPRCGEISGTYRAGDGASIAPACVIYPGVGRWLVDGLPVPYAPEVGYPGHPFGFVPLRSGEGCASTYHPACPYLLEVVATDGVEVVAHTYRLTMSASWGGDQR